MLAEASSTHGRSDDRRALIYGAGEAGVMLLREVRANPTIGYKICGFVDDDPAKTGRSIHRVKVFGTGDSPVSYTHLDVYKRQGKHPP